MLHLACETESRRQHCPHMGVPVVVVESMMHIPSRCVAAGPPWFHEVAHDPQETVLHHQGVADTVFRQTTFEGRGNDHCSVFPGQREVKFESMAGISSFS